TMGFLVILLLCGVGYLIYWILSIRSREMIFGILRAGGMHKGEIFHILINEQIFCGGFSVAAGILIGKLSCDMFVPILQTAYVAANQILPLQLITRQQDLIRLYGVTGAVLALCLCILFGLVQRLNVAKALKLGEE
ncbi:MAG: ABC transporter permease, partial [Acetatifactor sp.]|nr:ABC transporter permease [Acetatifactor sp.]